MKLAFVTTFVLAAIVIVTLNLRRGQSELQITDAVNSNVDAEAVNLVSKLVSGDSSQRMDAAKRLGEKKGKVGIDELIASLNDKNQYVRGWAAWALGEIGTQRAVDPLIAALAKY
ncbi:MAG TPA: HEAT repeat domain-containing protein, partial [Gemmataceae bacterium]|nr:HEAT repeat domain-containing protein [Gemmataceae bacterium]